jgi:hypothetical protein
VPADVTGNVVKAMHIAAGEEEEGDGGWPWSVNGP